MGEPLTFARELARFGAGKVRKIMRNQGIDYPLASAQLVVGAVAAADPHREAQ